MTDTKAELAGLIERLHETLGEITVPDLMHGDNLAITLCTAYDNPDQDTDEETGWTPDAISGQETVLAAIRAHYDPLRDALTTLQQERDTLSARVDALEALVVEGMAFVPDIPGRYDWHKHARAALSDGRAGGMEQPKRIQLKRTKGWRMPEGAVKVDRSTRWGNPFTVSNCRDAGYRGTDHEIAARCVSAFEAWLGPLWRNNWQGPESEAARSKILNGLSDLKGKDLACWCPPDAPCHADVLLHLANAARRTGQQGGGE